MKLVCSPLSRASQTFSSVQMVSGEQRNRVRSSLYAFIVPAYFIALVPKWADHDEPFAFRKFNAQMNTSDVNTLTNINLCRPVVENEAASPTLIHLAAL